MACLFAVHVYFVCAGYRIHVKHFSFVHLCITKVPSKSDSKHDAVWLDVNCFSEILSKVWPYPIHFTTNNTLINCPCNQKFSTSLSFSHLPYPCSPHFAQLLKIMAVYRTLITSSAKCEVCDAHIWMVHS